MNRRNSTSAGAAKIAASGACGAMTTRAVVASGDGNVSPCDAFLALHDASV